MRAKLGMYLILFMRKNVSKKLFNTSNRKNYKASMRILAHTKYRAVLTWIIIKFIAPTYKTPKIVTVLLRPYYITIIVNFETYLETIFTTFPHSYRTQGWPTSTHHPEALTRPLSEFIEIAIISRAQFGTPF